MSTVDKGTPNAALRTVLGTRDGFAIVRVGSYSAMVALLPKSPLPAVGESILVVQSEQGLLGIVPPPNMTKIKHNAWLPVPPVPPHNTLETVACRLVSWEITANISGNLTLDILKNGVSIVGATPPTLTAQITNVGLVGDDWDVTFADGDIITFATSGVTGITTIRVAIPAVRV